VKLYGVGAAATINAGSRLRGVAREQVHLAAICAADARLRPGEAGKRRVVGNQH
jgi:hypothetical protein